MNKTYYNSSKFRGQEIKQDDLINIARGSQSVQENRKQIHIHSGASCRKPNMARIGRHFQPEVSSGAVVT